jgi:hypothetical protein
MACQNNQAEQEANATQGIENSITAVEQPDATPVHPDGYSTPTGVTPPLRGVDVPVHQFKIQANKARTIQVGTLGTSIEIPADAFVDAQGQPVQGEVNIEFKEYHSISDIMVSGIPMQLTSPDGSTGYMQSAGMFDIQGSSGGQPVFIREGKTVTVNLASQHQDGDYDFWRLDKEAKQWLNKGPSKPQTNPTKAQARERLRKAVAEAITAPVKPYRFDNKKPVLEFDINLDNFPHLKEMGAVMWQYAGSDDKRDPAKNPWVLKEPWDAAEVEPYDDGSNLYRLVLRNDKKEFITTVCPNQSGAEFKESMEEYATKLKSYEENKVTQSEMKELVKQQADFIRSYAVEGFGIYNYDIMLKDDDFVPLLVDFDFGDLMIPGLHKLTTVYMITDNRNVVKYPPHDWNRIRINPNAETKMVALLPGNRYATLSSDEFEDLMPSIKAARGKEYTFKMNVHGNNTIASLSDLKQVLDRLV